MSVCLSKLLGKEHDAVHIESLPIFFFHFGNSTSEEGKETTTYRYPKFETNYLTFGPFEWNLSVYPFRNTPESEGRPLIYLTSFGHTCQVVVVMLMMSDRLYISS